MESEQKTVVNFETIKFQEFGWGTLVHAPPVSLTFLFLHKRMMSPPR